MRVIGVDWGSTHVRAFRFDGAGKVLETRRSNRGAASLKRNEFEPALVALLGDWLHTTPEQIIICGMAGSRDGWIEAPYLACPCPLTALASAALHPTTDLPVKIAPGLSVRGADGVHDIMRGEETQIYGAHQPRHATCILPGTHSKWVSVHEGAVTQIMTYMTGEFFHLLSSQSALARTIDSDAAFDESAFDQGVRRGLSGAALSRVAFNLRAEALFGALSPQAAKSYLSGVLIGAEIAEPLPNIGAVPLILIGAPEITKLYRRALSLAGVDVTVVDGEQAAAHGLWRIARGDTAS